MITGQTTTSLGHKKVPKLFPNNSFKHTYIYLYYVYDKYTFENECLSEMAF